MEMLNPPYGGMLVDLREGGEKHAFIRFASGLRTIQLSSSQLQELAALASGMLSPLDRFLNREALVSVLESMRLPNGALLPYPPTPLLTARFLVNNQLKSPLQIFRIFSSKAWKAAPFDR